MLLLFNYIEAVYLWCCLCLPCIQCSVCVLYQMTEVKDGSMYSYEVYFEFRPLQFVSLPLAFFQAHIPLETLFWSGTQYKQKGDKQHQIDMPNAFRPNAIHIPEAHDRACIAFRVCVGSALGP